MLCINYEKMCISYQPKKGCKNIYKDALFSEIKTKISDFVSNNNFESISFDNKILFIAFPLKKDCDTHKLKNMINEYNDKIRSRHI